MESTSLPNKIQASQKTADLIIESGKGNWLTTRQDLVNAKGKGMLQTYWLDPTRGKPGSTISSTADLETESSLGGDLNRPAHTFAPLEKECLEDKIERLIDWNVALFKDLLEAIVNHREQINARDGQMETVVIETICADEVSIRDEAVKTLLCMPDFESMTVLLSQNQIGLDAKVIAQLRSISGPLLTYTAPKMLFMDLSTQPMLSCRLSNCFNAWQHLM
jgi:hypothetical protein